MIFVNKTYRIYFLLSHPDTGAPITAPTDDVSVIIYDESGNKTTATATELSDGWYYYDLTPDAEGTWSVRFNYEGVTPYQKGGWADYAIADQDAKLDTIDGVVDQNYALLAHGTYGLSALKTLIDAKASSSALATVDANVDTLIERVTGAVALEATLTAMKGDGWTAETLKAIYDLIAALNDPTAQNIWEYATRTLTDPDSYKADVTNLDVAVSTRAPSGEYDTQLDQNLSTTESNIRGADSDDLKAISDQIDGVPTTAEAEGYVENAEDGGNLTHDITTANDTAETQIFEITKTGIYALSAFFNLDVLETAAEGGTVTIRFYNKIDGTNYSDIPSAYVTYVVGSENEYPSIEVNMLHGYSKATIQCSADVTATRTIAYRKITRDLGA